MALMYIPRQPQNQMFQILTNLAFQKMAHNQRMDVVDKQIQAEQVLMKQRQELAKTKEQEERSYEEQQNKLKTESDFLKAGYEPVPPPVQTATTTPVISGMNMPAQQDPDVIRDPITNKYFKKPKTEWKVWDQEVVVDGKKTKFLINNKGELKPITGPTPKGMGTKVTLADGTVVEVGGAASPLTKPAQATTEKEIIGMQDELLQIADIESNEFKEILTLPGQLKQKGLRLVDWLGMDVGKEGQTYLQKARGFVEGLEQYFNQYRKRITGAQAAIKEIEMLRTSVLNKKITPSEYVASVKRVKDMLQRGIRLKRMLLNRGVNDQKAVDKLFNAGDDVPDTELDRYGNQLESQGLTKEQVLQRLFKEGYITEEDLKGGTQ